MRQTIKPTDMHRRTLIIIAFLVFSAGALALAWPRPASPSCQQDSCSKDMESIDQPEKTSGKLLWESLPSQFFSSF
ncbi:MAG: hypothetical protein ABWZ25_08035 [Chitinophagaceae bacterium]